MERDTRTPAVTMDYDGGGGGGSLNLSSDQNGDTLSASAMSPDSNAKSKLQLPLSCDPPGPANPVKQLVWIVRIPILRPRKGEQKLDCFTVLYSLTMSGLL